MSNGGPKGTIVELDNCCKAFDEITPRQTLEKIKTIGDAHLPCATCRRRSQPKERVCRRGISLPDGAFHSGVDKLLLICQRQLYKKGTSLSFFTLEPYFAVMCFYYLLADGQPKAE